MKIIKSPELFPAINESTLFLDTNVLIGFRENKELFRTLLEEFIDSRCTLSTIPQVVFELTRGASTINKYKDIGDFLVSNKVVSVPIEKYSEDYPDLSFILQKISRGISYTDHLLCLCLCKFQNAFLLTEDRDIPVTIFDRPFLITIDTDKDLRTYAFYKYSAAKLNAFVSKLL